jgi:hypothetical protein
LVVLAAVAGFLRLVPLKTPHPSRTSQGPSQHSHANALVWFDGWVWDATRLSINFNTCRMQFLQDRSFRNRPEKLKNIKIFKKQKLKNQTNSNNLRNH